MSNIKKFKQGQNMGDLSNALLRKKKDLNDKQYVNNIWRQRHNSQMLSELLAEMKNPNSNSFLQKIFNSKIILGIGRY